MTRAAGPSHRRRAFSLIELLIALALSSALLTATLSALDAAWRGYKMTTESASTHVVARIVMHRMLAMVRTGTEFGPYPADFFDPDQNPVVGTSIEFVTEADRLAGINRVTIIDRRDSAAVPGEFELWYSRWDADVEPPALIDERPLLSGVRDAVFILEYQPGPRLVRATIDLSIQPREDLQLRIGVGGETPVIRLVASAMPRQLGAEE